MRLFIHVLVIWVRLNAFIVFSLRFRPDIFDYSSYMRLWINLMITMSLCDYCNFYIIYRENLFSSTFQKEKPETL